MIHGLLDALTPQQWGSAVAITIISAFIYRLGVGLKKGIDRRLKAWEENLLKGFPELAKELTLIRELLEKGQTRMGRQEITSDGHETRIAASEERIGIMQGEVKVLTAAHKETRTEIHGIILRENLAKELAKKTTGKK